MVQVEMKYPAIVLSLAILAFALLFPTLERFEAYNENLPRTSRRRRNLMKPIVPRIDTTKSSLPVFAAKMD